MESVSLSLMWCGREHQKIRSCLSKALAKFEAGDLVCASTETVRFVHDDQIPAGGDQVLESFAVIFDYLSLRPPAAFVHRFNGIHGADDLIMAPPDVFFSGDTTVGREITWDKRPEIFFKMRLHFGHPLHNQTLGRDDQCASDQTAEFELPHDQARFNGLSQPNLVG